MNCESVERELPLFFYGELTLEQEQAVQQHIEGCENCRRAFEAQRRVNEILDSRELEPPAALLSRCRRDLEANVAALAPKRRGWHSWFAPLFDWQAALKPAGAVALLAIGFFAARLTAPVAAPPVAPPAAGEPVMSRIRYVQPAASGNVQIVLDETRQRVLTGRPDDATIHRLLLAAARDSSDPGLRGETVDILKSRPESPDVRKALLQALEHDANAGVRLKALEALKSYAAQPDVRNALASVLLKDDNPGVRTQAIDLLIQNKEDAIVGVLQELMQKDDNSYVRLRCQKALEEMNASVGTF